MKATQQMFNPAIEDYKILKEIVVERKDDLNSILDRLESTPLKGTSRNFIVTGPRGIGKTHFLLLIYYEIKERKGLKEKYVSIKFSEEEYSIDSLAFFFIRIIEEMLNEFGGEKEKKQIRNFLELNSKLENREFVNRADVFLEKLMHKHRKKIVLCCENLDEMFKKISSSDKTDLARLRSILQSRDYLLIMGSASTYFKEIKEYGKPFYHFFEQVRLSNLSDKGIEELIMKLAEIEDNKRIITEFDRFRPKIKIITHFTGGVPRLVRMLYYVIANAEITAVMEEFEKLLDEVTPYYQSRMMSLSPQQQKIMDIIALGEGTCTPTEIADAGRMDRAIVNAMVKKLADAGFIQLVEQRRRKERRYDITEKLFRIWREMRMAKSRERVKYLTDFLRLVYNDDDFERHLSEVDKKFFGCLKEDRESALKYVRECEVLKDIIPRRIRPDFECRLIEKYVLVGEHEKADDELKYVKNLMGKTKFSKRFDEKIFKLEVKKIDKILEKNPDDVSGLLEKGQLLFEKDKYEEALAVFDRVLDIDSENEEALVMEASLFIFFEKYKEALHISENVLKINLKNERGLMNKIFALFCLKKFKEALQVSEAILKINPKNELAIYMKGRTYSALREYKEAIQLFEDILKINPKNEEALMMKGKTCALLGKDKEAIQIFEDVLKINPKNEEALMMKGKIIGGSERYNEALKCFEKIIEINPNNEQAMFMKGIALCGLKKYKEALQVSEDVLKINPKNEEALYTKGGALNNLGKHKEAILMFEKVLKINPKNNRALETKGLALFHLEKYKEAIHELDKALIINPKNDMVLAMKGFALFCLDKYKETMHELDNALKINPKNEVALRLKGEILLDFGRYKEAMDISEKVLKINPKDEEALFLKAKPLFALKKDKEAIVILDKILKISPKNEEARCLKGVAIYCRDKYKETGQLEDMYDLFLEYFLNLLRINVEHCEEMFNIFKYRFGEKFLRTFDMVSKTITYFKFKKDEDKDEELVLEKLFPEEREIVNMLIEKVEKKV